jgi:hypothetical protein
MPLDTVSAVPPHASGDVIEPVAPAQATTDPTIDHMDVEPMADDGTCSLPLLPVALNATRIELSPLIEAPPRVEPGIAIDWPMLEPWSRRPDEPVPYVASPTAKAAKAFARAGAVAAAKPLPQPEPDPEPVVQAPRPRAKPVAAPAAASPAPAAPAPSPRLPFEAVAKDAP